MKYSFACLVYSTELQKRSSQQSVFAEIQLIFSLLVSPPLLEREREGMLENENFILIQFQFYDQNPLF